MARDTDASEAHDMLSSSAASDGSSDELELELDIVADWRDASEGSSTRWLCSDEGDLSFQISIHGSDGTDDVDCRTWGKNTSIWSDLEGAPLCDELWEQPDDTAGDTGTDTGSAG
jgi:hypothetical protein